MTPREEQDNLRIEVDRATRAQNILNETIVKDAMQDLRDEAITAFKRAPIDSPAELQSARMRYDLTEAFLNKFVKHIQTGKLAEPRFAELRKLLGAKKSDE